MTDPETSQPATHRHAEKCGHRLWNSLEVMKLVVPIFSAMLIAGVGYMISQSLDRSKMLEDQLQRYQNAVVTKRMSLYDEIGRNIDGLYSYYFYVGRWKESTPDEMLQKLRSVDDVMFTYQPVFSKTFFDTFVKLRDELFQKDNHWGEDLKLRTTAKFRRKYGKEWHGDWDRRFTNEDNRQAICAVYNEFLTGLISELHIDALTNQKIINFACPMYDIRAAE